MICSSPLIIELSSSFPYLSYLFRNGSVWIKCQYDASQCFIFFSISNHLIHFKFYFRGVAHPHRSFCNPEGLNHGVLLVGYGVEEKSLLINISLEIIEWIVVHRFEIDSILDHQEQLGFSLGVNK